MRTATAGEQTVLQGRHSKQYLWIEIQDETAAWVDYSDYVNVDLQDSAEVGRDINERIMQATVRIARDVTGGSLSPLINADIDLGRGLRIYGARVAHGTTPAAGDKKLLFDGRIDRWEAAQDPMVLTGRDNSGILRDRWVETPTLYGSEAGVAIQTVMQSIIDDHADSAFTLQVAAGSGILSTPFLISPEYLVEEQPVWDALVALAELIGYVIEYRWSDSAAAFQLTLMEPDRTTTTVQWTFGADDYYDITKLDADLIDVRNAWTLSYKDASTGNRTTVTSVDAASIARFGIRLWAQIVEGDDSPIDSAAEAQAMVDAAAADTGFPTADHEIETDLFWPVQLGDYYQHTANSIHYDADQDFAVAGFWHTWANGVAETRILTRGKPAGNPYSWRRRAMGLPTGAVAGKMWVTVDENAKTLDLYASTEGAAVNYPVTIDVYEDVPTGVAILSHTFAAPDETIGPTGSGADTEYAALTDFALPKVGILLYYGKLTDRNGVVRWISTAGDLDSLPGGVCVTEDYQAQPKLICTYDDDVRRIIVTTPSGIKTYSGLSGGGQFTYQVGVTALDSASTEADMTVDETRTYSVVYYGGATAGATFTAFSGPLHGEPSGPPAIVIETEEELTVAGETIACSEDGYVSRASAICTGSWAGVRDGIGTAYDFYRTGATIYCDIQCCGTTDQYQSITRAILAFPTTGLDETTEPSTASYVQVKVSSVTETLAGQSIVLSGVVPDDPALLVYQDYDNMVDTAYSSAVTLASITGGDVLQFLLNEAGVTALTAAIAAQTPFCVAIRIEADRSDTEPTWSSGTKAQVDFYAKESATEAYRPLLSVTGDIPKARVTLRHSDPGGLTQEIQYRTKAGSADWPASWSVLLDNDPTPVPTGVLSSNPIDVAIVESPQSWVQARLAYLWAGETLYSSPITSSGFDRGRLPNVVAKAVLLDNGTAAGVEVSGDFDTRSVKVAFTSGSNPSLSSTSDVRSRSAIDGRTFTADEVSFGYDDIPVALDPGESAIFAVLGYTAVSGGGREATNVEYAQVTRPYTPGAADPTIDTLTAAATDDTAGGVDLQADWTVSNVVDGTHDMEIIAEWPEGIDYGDSDTETTPDAVTTLTINFAGAGAGGADPIPTNTKCKVTALLKNQATGAVLHSKVTYSVGIAT